MHFSHQPQQWAVETDRSPRYDEAGFWFRYTVLDETSEIGSIERWERLSRRIRSYQQVQAIVAHATTHGRSAQRALLMSRYWPSLMLPLG
jgi:hypothetical protein